MDLATNLAIGVPLATGATWLAYTHPKSYARLAYAVLGFSFIAGAFFTGYRMALDAARSAVAASGLPTSPRLKLDNVLIAHDQSALTASLYFIAILAFGTFLWSFPLWLNKDEQ